MSPVGSSGTESTGGSQWRLSAAQGPLDRVLMMSLLLSPFRNPSPLYSKLCLLWLLPLRFLKRPQWPLGWQSLDTEGGEEGGAWRSRSFYLGEQMGTSATPVWPESPIKKTGEASSENMSTFQFRALECWDNVVIRTWMNGTVHLFCLFPCRVLSKDS